ncbi:MAG: serine/threonine protein kinase [Chloroflexi bacterium]|nr:serine/threonine protein kinase [Chloroflexota bacterium]
MPHPLLDHDVVDLAAEQYLRSVGTVFAEFGALTQDSGNVSYGVRIGAQRYFVKTAGRPDDPLPALDHPARIALLRNAVRLRRSCEHVTLPSLYHVIESPTGPLLIYEWLDGELLNTPHAQRDDPTSAFQRFRSLPADVILGCLDAIYDLHDQIVRAGWIAIDFYDGCLIYDFAAGRLGVIDLDTYAPSPFHNSMGRMFGSTRFMAPEEFVLGALIDERTNVFVMGRTALVLLSDGTLDTDTFRGSLALFQIVAKACDPRRSHRFNSMAAFCHAWRTARAQSNDSLATPDHT